ncbi:hypothetical protein BDN72DRAFT_858087 [Pluteus cervinus]|uniref:Uncharacterized protein n=1 Tax=Pluteus cervinus TaxID=181527 RepID=A0ACD3ATG6_9AGAR|nr:hypothetical protein BDN72DRAFT_858087 [Pluteus cervinus]
MSASEEEELSEHILAVAREWVSSDSDAEGMSVTFAGISSSSTVAESSSIPSSFAVDTPLATTTANTVLASMEGAIERVLDVCTSIHIDGPIVAFIPTWKGCALQNTEVLASQGFRALVMP